MPYFFSLSGEKEVNTLDKNKTVSNTFEVLKFFLPHLKKVDRIYPNVIIGKKKKGGKKIRMGKSNTDILIFGNMPLSFKM